MKDILEIVGEYGLSLVKEGEILRALCPFHQDTGRPNFTVYPETDSWFCFACSVGGDPVDFVARFEGITKKQALAKLRGDMDVWQEISEIADGLLVPDEDVRNTDCDFMVRRICREFMQKNPKHIDVAMSFLQHFDQDLKEQIDRNKMQDILNKLGRFITNPRIFQYKEK